MGLDRALAGCGRSREAGDGSDRARTTSLASADRRGASDAAPTNPDLGDVGPRSPVDDLLQHRLVIIAIGEEADGSLRMRGVDRHGIEMLADRERADRQIERPAAADGGEVEGGAPVDRRAGAAAARRREVRIDAIGEEPRCRDRHPAGVEERSARAAGDVRAEPDIEALREGPPQRKDRIGEIDVGKRAVAIPALRAPITFMSPSERKLP